MQFAILFLAQIILARHLSPVDFGSFALISTLVMFLHTLGNTHTDRFLIASKKNSQKNLNNIFTVELTLCLFLLIFSILFIPRILLLIGRPELTRHAQVFSIIILQNPLVKPRALLEKRLSFLSAILPALISNIIGAATAVFLVNKGFGLWSLVWWKVITFGAESLITWLVIPCKPRLAFDIQVIRESFMYSSPVMFAAIIAYIYSNIDYYLINYLMDAKTLGFYWMAYQASHYLLSIRASVNRVIFPFVSGMDSIEEQKVVFSIMTSLTSVIFFIIVFLVLLFAEDLVVLIYGVKWLPSAILIKIFTCIVLFKAVSSTSIPLLHASGVTMPDLEISLLNFFILPPVIYLMARYFGAAGAASALLLVGNITIGYIHQKYVKPLCGKGYFSYYGKILSFLLLGIAFICVIKILGATIFFKTLSYLFLLITLFISYRTDLALIFKLLKQGELK
ncbi:MAG: oligosaccharide flippase family protein [Bacteriovoracaceae bacterium]|nr:oligosaccharide flippase family protein [Bacteriovoracaceae bacterium]